MLSIIILAISKTTKVDEAKTVHWIRNQMLETTSALQNHADAPLFRA